jgi:hypothetical protein
MQAGRQSRADQAGRQGRAEYSGRSEQAGRQTVKAE